MQHEINYHIIYLHYLKIEFAQKPDSLQAAISQPAVIAQLGER